MKTSLDINGANCPFCFNETLDDLARIDGVCEVVGSMGGSCVVVDHDDHVAVEALVETVQRHLHGVAMFSNEIEMASIDPVALSRPCAHHVHGAPSSSPQGELQISPSMTLGEIVTLKPSLAPDLQAQGFDFCCHGNRTLADAAAELDLDADMVAAGLSATRREEPPAEWAFLRPVDLIDHIVTVHHGYLWDEMPRIGELIDKIVDVHGERHPELTEVRRVYRDLRGDFEPHLTTEEQVVFPAMRELMAPTSRRPESAVDELHQQVHTLTDQHEVVGELLEQLRDITDGYTVPADGCATYKETYRALSALEADTHLHVHKENNVLFPAVDDAASASSAL